MLDRGELLRRAHEGQARRGAATLRDVERIRGLRGNISVTVGERGVGDVIDSELLCREGRLRCRLARQQRAHICSSWLLEDPSVRGDRGVRDAALGD